MMFGSENEEVWCRLRLLVAKDPLVYVKTTACEACTVNLVIEAEDLMWRRKEMSARAQKIRNNPLRESEELQIVKKNDKYMMWQDRWRFCA